MGVINTFAFPKNLDKSIDRMFYDQYMKYESEHDKVAKFQAPDPGKSIKEAETSGVGNLVEKPEGSAIQYKVPYEGNEQTYYYNAYALGVYITKEMLDDELHGIMKKIGVGGLARSAAQMKELKFWNLLNNPTATATNTCKDGAAIISTSHTLLNGGTLANRPATDADLSETSLQAAFDYFYHDVVDEVGMPISMKPAKLIVSSDNYWTANRLHQQQYGVASANRDDMTTNPENKYLKGGWEVFVSRYLTPDMDAWFLISDDADLRFVWKDKPISEKDYDFDLKAWKWSIYMRFACFCYDYKGIYGTTGI